jgi:hypothetical protein
MTRSKWTRGLAPLALLVLGGASSVAACSSGSDSHAPPISSGGSSSDAGSAGTKGRPLPGSTGGPSSTVGGQGAEAGEGGQSEQDADGGAAGLPGGIVVTVTPGACSEKPGWGGAAPLDGVSTAADESESLLSITADELDIVFMRGGAVYLAHRDTASASFGAASVVTLPSGYVADAGAALSGDGMTLVLISSDERSFGSLSRASRSANFGATIDTSAFGALNERALQTLEHFAAPVLAPNGNSFLFTGFTPGDLGAGGAADTGNAGVSVVYESSWSSGVWNMPSNISQDLFNGTGDQRPLPSGLSSDSRTLFYFDEATGKESARFRDRADAPLYDVIDLGDLQGAVPNTQCDRIYYSSAGNVLTESD